MKIRVATEGFDELAAGGDRAVRIAPRRCRRRRQEISRQKPGPWPMKLVSGHCSQMVSTMLMSPPVPFHPRIPIRRLLGHGVTIALQVEEDGQAELAAESVHGDGVGVVEPHADLEFAVDADAVDVHRRLEPGPGETVARVGCPAADEPIRMAFEALNDQIQGRADAAWVHVLVVGRAGLRVLELRLFPGQKPGLLDAVFVHVADERIDVVAVPVGVVVDVDDPASHARDLPKSCSDGRRKRKANVQRRTLNVELRMQECRFGIRREWGKRTRGEDERRTLNIERPTSNAGPRDRRWALGVWSCQGWRPRSLFDVGRSVFETRSGCGTRCRGRHGTGRLHLLLSRPAVDPFVSASTLRHVSQSLPAGHVASRNRPQTRTSIDEEDQGRHCRVWHDQRHLLQGVAEVQHDRGCGVFGHHPRTGPGQDRALRCPEHEQRRALCHGRDRDRAEPDAPARFTPRSPSTP